ncbi:MAG TPA: ABC transporter substrate-binding protein, partial [Burkholderiales bacterium]|nr:ABC transporter substrate-binding protein [Burkholderiales bacterium]
VFFSCDPSEHVTQLAHPGGNVTGSTCMSSELIAKRLELLKELIPRASRVAYLSNPQETPTDWMRARDAASQLGVTLRPFSYEGSEQVSNALKAVGIWQPDAIFVNPDAALVAGRGQLADFALKQRLPAIYTFPVFAEVGGLISYGSRISEGFVSVADQVAAILGGARPGDVPVRRATIFHLVINLKTAKALGITVPPALLLRADKVIE